MSGREVKSAVDSGCTTPVDTNYNTVTSIVSAIMCGVQVCKIRSTQGRNRSLSICLSVCSIYLSKHSCPLSSSSATLSAQGSGRPWLPSVMAASPLTAAVSCGLALNCAPATVNVYVYQSNAMCLCYMALWTRRLSKTHRLEECGPGRGVYGPLSI